MTVIIIFNTDEANLKVDVGTYYVLDGLRLFSAPITHGVSLPSIAGKPACANQTREARHVLGKASPKIEKRKSRKIRNMQVTKGFARPPEPNIRKIGRDIV